MCSLYNVYRLLPRFIVTYMHKQRRGRFYSKNKRFYLWRICRYIGIIHVENTCFKVATVYILYKYIVVKLKLYL